MLAWLKLKTDHFLNTKTRNEFQAPFLENLYLFKVAIETVEKGVEYVQS